MNKQQIAALFNKMGTLLELAGENPFKIRAYRNAARRIEDLEEELSQIVSKGKLNEIPGIGTALQKKILELLETGTFSEYEELLNSTPPGLVEMLQIPGLGAKKVKALHDTLSIKTLEELEENCLAGEIRQLSGFGQTTEQNILDGIRHLKEYSRRNLWWNGNVAAAPILNGLRGLKEVQRAELAGSMRRCNETIRDLDFLVVSDHSEAVMEWFTTYPKVTKVAAKGATKSSVRLTDGIQADLRVVDEKTFPFAWVYFTGSKEHNIELRRRANRLGYSLNEYELSNKTGPIRSEEELYHALNLAYIPPELREDRGEFKAAENDALPNLITPEDIQGTFHCHTTESDGQNSLVEMVLGAQEKGWSYIGITDHSKSSYQAKGLDEDRLMKQVEEIQGLNRSGKYAPYVFAGTECDIHTDGSLDFADEILGKLDFVIVSIHRSFKMDKEAMTKRMIRAIENPYVTMVGHLTGRLLLRREPYLIDVPKVIDAAIANNKIIEFNCNPWRMDMDWRFWRHAVEKGLMCSINPDAHSAAGLDVVGAGVKVARKGWLEKRHVLNTYSLEEVKQYLQ